MSHAVSPKSAVKTQKQKTAKLDAKSSPPPTPSTFKPQELVLRPTPIRRYFE